MSGGVGVFFLGFFVVGADPWFMVDPNDVCGVIHLNTFRVKPGNNVFNWHSGSGPPY